MRTKLIAPLAAAFALAACGGGGEEKQDSVSLDDAVAEAADSGAMPRPGRYRSTQELIEFEMPGMPADQMTMMRNAFAEGAAEESTYCITETMTREKWLSDMAESNCTIGRFDVDGGEIDVAMTCSGDQGVSGSVEMKGTAGENSSNMVMSFVQQIPGMGEGRIKMRVKSERTGDC